MHPAAHPTPTPILSLAICLMLIGWPAAADEQAQLDGAESAIRLEMAALLAETGAPGVLVGIRAPGGATAVWAEGIDDFTAESPTALATDRLFRVGSVTKPFTAALVFGAVEDGLWSLDDTIGTHMPEIANPTATLEQLLAHDAGLANWDGLDGGSINALLIPNLTRQWLPEELVPELADLEPFSMPGAGFHYSNPGYQMLGVMLERVTEMSVADLIARDLVAGLGMVDTRFAFGAGEPVPERLIHGQGAVGPIPVDSRTLAPQGIDTLFYTAGAAYSTIPDLLIFAHAYWAEDGALPPPGVDVGLDRSGNFGLATQFFAPEVLGHTGDIIGSRTAIGFDRARGFAVAVHVNSNLIDRQPTVDLALAAIEQAAIAVPAPGAVASTACAVLVSGWLARRRRHGRGLGSGAGRTP